MRSFNEGDTITIEPWRAGAFPVIKDLIVDRTAFEKIHAILASENSTTPDSDGDDAGLHGIKDDRSYTLT